MNKNYTSLLDSHPEKENDLDAGSNFKTDVRHKNLKKNEITFSLIVKQDCCGRKY